MEDGWQINLARPVDTMVVNTMTHIRADAQSACPVDTGDLRDSLTVIHAGPGRARMISHLPYFAATELGYHGPEDVREYVNHDFMGSGRAVVIRAHTQMGNTPSQPFARPALYRRRVPS